MANLATILDKNCWDNSCISYLWYPVWLMGPPPILSTMLHHKEKWIIKQWHYHFHYCNGQTSWAVPTTSFAQNCGLLIKAYRFDYWICPVRHMNLHLNSFVALCIWIVSVWYVSIWTWSLRTYQQYFLCHAVILTITWSGSFYSSTNDRVSIWIISP